MPQKKYLKFSGPIIIFALSLIPVVIWLTIYPLSQRFSGSSLILTSVGQLSALVGLAMFSSSLVLSTRLKALENYFGGMNRVYVWHHFFGALAFILLLLHPGVLLVKMLSVSLSAATNFILPDSDWTKDLGIYSLLIMAVLLVITFYIKIKYERWKFTHKFLGVAFFLGALHGFSIYSDIQNSAVLRYYMFIIVAFGVASYVYRTVLNLYARGRYEYRLDQKIELGDNVSELVLTPVREAMAYHPGQFVFLTVMSPGLRKETHPFSLSSGSKTGPLRVAFKALGDYTDALKQIGAEAKVMIEGPFGRFSHEFGHNLEQIWIAGGIGITPFLSMAESLLETGKKYKIKLFYCVNNRNELVFVDRLKQIEKQCSDFQVLDYCSNERGRVSGEFISQAAGSITNKDIFICGPAGMMTALKSQFSHLGVAKHLVHTEEFNLY